MIFYRFAKFLHDLDTSSILYSMLNNFLNFCDENYVWDERCPDCLNDCPETGNCQQCLENIHYHNDERPYNCQNILYFYSCHYGHKYSSEIAHLFNLNFFDELPEYRILSLGAGSCVDFLGVHDLTELHDEHPQIDYHAVEINNLWSTQNDWIEANFVENFSIEYTDVFNFLENSGEFILDFNPNIIIISYLLSDLINANRDINRFIDLLLNNVFAQTERNSVLIVNDYNRGLTTNDPRSHYSSIIQRVRNIAQVNVYRYHFAHNYLAYYRYGDQHPSNAMLFPILENIDRYNPWRFCSSAQIVIQKTE